MLKERDGFMKKLLVFLLLLILSSCAINTPNSSNDVTYNINISNEIKNGDVIIQTTTAKAGEEVKVYTVPDKGYKFSY